MLANRPLLPGIFILLSLLLTLPLSAEDARWGAPFLRHPSVSPDGRTVAFSYAGDIWTVPSTGGAARRLTVNPAYDANPVFSSDGSQIAFNSDRAGNTDVFVIDTAGTSEPRQITYHGGRETPVGWTPDGSEVIFLAVRELSPRRIPTPYRVPRRWFQDAIQAVSRTGDARGGLPRWRHICFQPRLLGLVPQALHRQRKLRYLALLARRQQLQAVHRQRGVGGIPHVRRTGQTALLR